jgi:predicted glutamine amidotransferase
MCIAILAKPGAKVTNLALFKGWGVNKDGAGIAYVDKAGKLVVDKGHMKYNDFQTAYEKACEELVADDSPMLVHMRYTSAGTTNASNTHPFKITPQTGPAGAFIHNGTMFRPAGEWEGPEKDRKSDTRVVASALNNILALESVLNSIVEMGQAIGSHNKLAFLYEDKSWAIIN